MTDVKHSATTRVLGRTAWMGLVVQLLVTPEGGVYSAAMGTSGRAMTSISDSGLTASAERQVSLSGRLHIIWNGEPRFFLIDDRGVAVRLVIDEALTKAFGGPRGLNQRRVTITGERAGELPEAVRVLSIHLETESK